jgi:hypothetical protein
LFGATLPNKKLSVWQNQNMTTPKFRLLLAAAIAVTLTIISCHKNASNEIVTPSTGTNITAVVVGRIINDQNQPVAGATVTAGTFSATTNVNGEFRINDAALNEQTAFVSVEKAGYFKGSRTFIARQGQKHYVEIMLLPKQLVGSFSATTGASISVADGSFISLPANAVVTASSNAAYTGTVNVAMAWIDPSSANMYRQMPGDLRGIDAAGAENVLQSYGMLAVELIGNSGEKLQIASGKKATIKFPLPTSVQGSAPATIALWSFNDTTGLWKQEGTATKTGNVYVADVSHFSFWNVDAPYATATFKATFLNQVTGQPLQHATVRIKRSNGSYGYGNTDSTGFVQGFVPFGETLVLEVLANYTCNTPVHSQNIGPFTTGSINALGNINVTLSTSSTITLTGTIVNCSSAPVTNGYVDVRMGNYYYRTSPNSVGTFSLSFVSCSPTVAVSYYAVDNATNQQSATVNTTLTGSSSAGTLSACGISTARFVNYTLDGVNYSFTSPADSILYYQQGLFYAYSPSRQLQFSANATGIGSYPLTNVYAFFAPNSQYRYNTSNNAMVTTTEFSNTVGGYIAGSFNTVLHDSISPTVNHTFQCNFRVRR